MEPVIVDILPFAMVKVVLRANGQTVPVIDTVAETALQLLAEIIGIVVKERILGVLLIVVVARISGPTVMKSFVSTAEPFMPETFESSKDSWVMV